MSADALRVRGMTLDDSPQVYDLCDRYQRAVMDRRMPISYDQFVSELSVPGRVLDVDETLVHLDGRLVGSGSVWAMAPYTEISLYISADQTLPPTTGAAVRQLLVDALATSAAHHTRGLDDTAPRHAVVQVPERDELTQEVARSNGFAFERQLLLMAIDQTTTDVPEPRWPAGITVRPLTSDDGALVGELVRDAFSEHAGDNQFDDDAMSHFLSKPGSRLDLSLLAADDEGPVGMILCEQRPTEGFVTLLGVRRRARGLGLGTALLRQAFRGFAADGVTLVRLAVEQENTTGAVGVYEGAGMRRRHALQMWTRPLVG